MKTLYVVISVVLASILSCIVAIAAPPIPNDVQMVQPDPSLPKELAAFSGKWKGVWTNRDSSGRLDAVLIVEKIDDKNAVVVYCWGNSSEWRVNNGWRRYTADINKNDGRYTLSFEGGFAKFEFWLSGEKLSGTDNKWRNTIMMKRMP